MWCEIFEGKTPIQDTTVIDGVISMVLMISLHSNICTKQHGAKVNQSSIDGKELLFISAVFLLCGCKLSRIVSYRFAIL